LEGGGIEVWVDGGWGVDALAGRQSRPHDDLDVVVRIDQVGRLWEVLTEAGFEHTPAADDRPWNFVVTDRRGRRIDVHAVTFDAAGDARYGPPEAQDVGWPAGTLEGTGTIGGRAVRCTVAAQQIASHAGYELRPKDHRDLKVLRSLA
jgi:lincosamide nucleotidyltransferase A/C/D/E